MAITAGQVKELREATGAGMMDCKKALAENNGDMDAAKDFLRKKGLAAASKKAGRVAAEGAVGSYVHMGGRIGVLVEINCETDFVAKTDEFQELVRDIAMHIAGAPVVPLAVSREDIDPDVLAKEREMGIAQAKEQGKPEKIWDKIADGKVEKFVKDSCLLEQVFVKDPDGKQTIKDLLTEKVAKIGENIQVRRFSRFELGEGIEKKESNLAAEVAEALGN